MIRLLDKLRGHRRQPIPDDLWAFTVSSLPFLDILAPDEQRQLRNLAEDFLAEKEFSTAGGLELTDEAWATIDDEEKNPIGQYTFTYNGGTYTLRAAKDTGDISGVWENGTTLGNGREGDVTAITTENGGLWSRWFDGDMQYSLYAEGAAMDDYTAVRNAMA